MGVKVYPYDENLLTKLIEKNIKSVIVTPYNMDKLKDNNFTEQLLSNNIKIMIIPNLSEWNSMKRSLSITTASIGDRLFWGTLKPFTLYAEDSLSPGR